MTRIVSALIGTLLITLVGALFLACRLSDKPAGSGLSASTPVGAAPMPAPVRVCVPLDKTGSAVPNLVPQIRIEEFRSVFDLMQRSGGELAFGILNAASDHPLVRLRIDPPPTEPTPPALTGNAFKDAQVEEDHEQRRREWEEAYTAWRDETGRKISAFEHEVEPLLAEQPGGNTDIYGALRRCDLFLTESDASWPEETVRYLALVTDGEHTVQGQPVSALASNATVLVVNASGSLGVLEVLQPLRFESVAAAFEFMAATEASR